jgi:hypothetical protein
MKTATSDETTEWAPILPDSNKMTGLETDKVRDLLVATRDQTTIYVRNNADISLPVLGEVTRLNDAQTAKHPALLNRFDPEAVMANDGLLALAEHSGTIRAAVHAARTSDDELSLGSLVADGSIKGIAVPLIAALVLGDEHWTGTAKTGSGVARILPDGMVNIGSSKTLSRLGFYALRVFTHPMTLRNPQKAVNGSAEAGGAPLWYLRFEGRADEVADRSREALDGWSTEFGLTAVA